MSKPIGMKGLPRIAGMSSNNATRELVFKANGLTTKHLALDPTVKYGLFGNGAGNSNITIEATSDSPDMIAAGQARYVTLKNYDDLSQNGGFFGATDGVTGLRVTHEKEGIGADNATILAALGGRFVLRAVAGVPDGDGGMGTYTALNVN